MRCAALTIFAVVGDLHLALLRAQQGLGHLGHRVPAGELSVQEVTSARLLHDVRPGEARHLAEAVVTVDDSAVLHTGIGYEEFLVWNGRDWETVIHQHIITQTRPIYCRESRVNEDTDTSLSVGIWKHDNWWA